MKLWRFEGSPEEFSAVANVLMGEGDSPVKVENTSPEPERRADGQKPSRKFVTVDEAKNVLTRIPLKEPMANVLRVLLESGERRILSEELMKSNNHSVEQFRGLMGAFGRRLVNTVGTTTWFFDDKWDHERHQNTYRLPPSVRQALKDLDIL